MIKYNTWRHTTNSSQKISKIAYLSTAILRRVTLYCIPNHLKYVSLVSSRDLVILPRGRIMNMPLLRRLMTMCWFWLLQASTCTVKASFRWHSSAAKSPERDLVEEGGVIFSVSALLSSDNLLRVALKTNIKQGKRTANIFSTFFGEEFGMSDQEKSEEKSAVLIDENFYQQFSNNEVGVLDVSNGDPAL